MRNIKKYILWPVVVLIALVVLGLGLYRLAILPEQTRVSCDEFARNAVIKLTEVTTRTESINEREDIYNYYYNSCFRQAGLKPEIR